jgi:hypothetical protein
MTMMVTIPSTCGAKPDQAEDQCRAHDGHHHLAEACPLAE